MTVYTIYVPKADKSYEYDWDTLPAASQEWIKNYGLTQGLVDKTANVTAKAFPDPAARLAEAVKQADLRDEQIRSGNVPGNRTPADPKVTAVKQLISTLVSKGFTLEQIAAKLVEPAPTESVLIPAEKKKKVA